MEIKKKLAALAAAAVAVISVVPTTVSADIENGGDEGLSNKSGYYLGDVNRDKVVTTQDVVEMNQLLLGMEKSFIDFDYAAADVNEDTTINIFDDILIKRMVLGVKDTEFVELEKPADPTEPSTDESTVPTEATTDVTEATDATETTTTTLAPPATDVTETTVITNVTEVTDIPTETPPTTAPPATDVTEATDVTTTVSDVTSKVTTTLDENAVTTPLEIAIPSGKKIAKVEVEVEAPEGASDVNGAFFVYSGDGTILSENGKNGVKYELDDTNKVVFTPTTPIENATTVQMNCYWTGTDIPTYLIIKDWTVTFDDDTTLSMSDEVEEPELPEGNAGDTPLSITIPSDKVDLGIKEASFTVNLIENATSASGVFQVYNADGDSLLTEDVAYSVTKSGSVITLKPDSPLEGATTLQLLCYWNDGVKKPFGLLVEDWTITFADDTTLSKANYTAPTE